MAIGFLQNEKLFDAAVDVLSDIVPGVSGVMLFEIGVGISKRTRG